MRHTSYSFISCAPTARLRSSPVSSASTQARTPSFDTGPTGLGVFRTSSERTRGSISGQRTLVTSPLWTSGTSGGGSFPSLQPRVISGKHRAIAIRRGCTQGLLLTLELINPGFVLLQLSVARF